MVFWANTSLGIGLALLGSLLSATGLVLQKHSHNIGESDFALWHRWRWWLGFVLLVIVGGCTDAVALMIAPLSVIAPLCGATLVFNALLAAHFLGRAISTVVYTPNQPLQASHFRRKINAPSGLW